jgi:hypothetical protein
MEKEITGVIYARRLDEDELAILKQAKRSGRIELLPSTPPAVFDASRLQSGLERRLPHVLREMADAIERGEMFAELTGFTPWGFNKDPRDARAHFVVKLHIASEIRKEIETKEGNNGQD